MKNVFKKTAALVSAISLMAAGTAVSVSAAPAPGVIEVEVQSETGTLVKAGEANYDANYNTYLLSAEDTKIKAKVVFVNDKDQEFDALCFQNSIDGLSVDKIKNGSLGGQQYIKPEIYAQWISSSGTPWKIGEIEADPDEQAEVDAENAAFVAYTFTAALPSDAAGKTFEIGWNDPSTYSFSLQNAKKDLEGSFKPARFIVEGAPVVTTTTPEVTTTIETTTTTAVSTSKVASTPATGSSNNGVAALAVTMAAAAGAAVALKKKKD